jgi:putative DNA primase/helicase
LLKKKRRKLIERPDYLTEDEWEEARRAAKEAKPGAQETFATGKSLHGVSDGEILSSEFSEDRLALRFADRHGNELRYVAAWGKWLAWTGTHWEIENTLAVFDMARKICREAAAQCNKGSVSSAIAKAKTVAAVETLARSDRRIAATIDQWDADPWALNTPGGIVNLTTGALQPHRQTDYATKITAARPGAGCPKFLEFLQTIFAKDQEIINYIQIVFGYALTGVTLEHALFFLHGTGANGKSVLVSTLAGMLGSYHRTAPIETFTANAVAAHPTDLAGLMGARLVTAVETEEGRRWAESKIKSLTGGDQISARFMRQDFFEFTPAFKLIIAGNHKPGLRSVDEAIRRRFHLVPFAVTIPPENRDKDLVNKLRAEWPGILQWAIDGCLRWQAKGLVQPQAVALATAAYLEAEDAIAAWIDERCERGANHWETAAKLFASWKAWAELAGEFVGSQKQFGEKLEAREITPARKHGGRRGYHGIRIIEAEPMPQNRHGNPQGDAW